jgi:hypothetical protein
MPLKLFRTLAVKPAGVEGRRQLLNISCLAVALGAHNQAGNVLQKPAEERKVNASGTQKGESESPWQRAEAGYRESVHGDPQEAT